MTPLLLTLALLHGADLGMTLDLLHRGASEANPFLSQRASVTTALVASETTFQMYGLHKVSLHHPKLAKILLLASISVEGAIVAHNAQQYRNLR